MELSELSIGMKIEDISVARDVRRYGTILKIDENNVSSYDGSPRPVIINLGTDKKPKQWHTDMVHHEITWIIVE